MNEKFLSRGKREDNGEWITGYYVKLPEHHIIFDLDGDVHYIIPETVGQYTGLIDKKGTKIFEGDILRGDIPSCLQKSQNCIGFVRYGESAFLIDFCKSREPWETQKVGFCSFWNYEVLGNIHDNHELIGGTE